MEKMTIKELIDEHLLEMAAEDPDCHRFGSATHKYQLHPPVSLKEVLLFESQQNIHLPEDYVYFLTNVGNGGAGPGYGIFPLGMIANEDGLVPWKSHSLVGDASQIFAFANTWNLPASVWEREPKWPVGTPDEVSDRLMEDWNSELEKTYYSPKIMNGAIPLCDQGCGLMTWLIVTGEQAGYVWHDKRADYQGLSPVRAKDGNQMSFLDWYLTWIEQVAFEPIPASPARTVSWNERHVISEKSFEVAFIVAVCIGLATGLANGISDVDGKSHPGVRMLCYGLFAGLFSLGILSLLDRMLLKMRNTPVEEEPPT